MDFWVMPLRQPRKNIDNDSLRFLLFHNRADSFFHPGHCPSECHLSQACLTVDDASQSQSCPVTEKCCLWGLPSSPTAVRTKLQWAKCLIDSDSAQWGLHGALCSPGPAMLPAVTLQASFACHPPSQRRSTHIASEQSLVVFMNVTTPPLTVVLVWWWWQA